MYYQDSGAVNASMCLLVDAILDAVFHNTLWAQDVFENAAEP